MGKLNNNWFASSCALLSLSRFLRYGGGTHQSRHNYLPNNTRHVNLLPSKEASVLEWRHSKKLIRKTKLERAPRADEQEHRAGRDNNPLLHVIDGGALKTPPNLSSLSLNESLQNSRGSNPLQVYILMGQSNMVGRGRIEPETTPGTLSNMLKLQPDQYSHLIDPITHEYVENKNFWMVRVTADKGQGWVKPGAGGRGGRVTNSFGVELQLATILGNYHSTKKVQLTKEPGKTVTNSTGDGPILFIKAAQGDRSLGWDILSPGSLRFHRNWRFYAGYGDSPTSWPVNETHPTPIDGWYAGKQYDQFVADTQAVLDDLKTYYPQYDESQGYVITGFVWWQGHKDAFGCGRNNQYDCDTYSQRYERNLSRLISELRKAFHSPNAPFVLGTIGFYGWQLEGNGLVVANAQLSVASENASFLVDNVKTVETRGYWKNGTESPSEAYYHYNNNAKTFYDVGTALGRGMVELLGRQDGKRREQAYERSYRV